MSLGSRSHQGRRENQEANDLSSDIRKNREEGYMDPNTMPTGMTRYVMRENCMLSRRLGGRKSCGRQILVHPCRL